jgi:hypothetical protein
MKRKQDPIYSGAQGHRSPVALEPVDLSQAGDKNQGSRRIHVPSLSPSDHPQDPGSRLQSLRLPRISPLNRRLSILIALFPCVNVKGVAAKEATEL